MAIDAEKTIKQAIADFDTIEKAIEASGVNVPYGTDTKEYGKLVKEVYDRGYNSGYSSGLSQSGALNKYTGEYTVKPKAIDQTLDTAQKMMIYDLVVEKIPFAEVSNDKGGTTVVIGE